jgi:hypothetical protein
MPSGNLNYYKPRLWVILIMGLHLLKFFLPPVGKLRSDILPQGIPDILIMTIFFVADKPQGCRGKLQFL